MTDAGNDKEMSRAADVGRTRCLTVSFNNKFERVDGGLLVRDVKILAEGTWTDSAVRTPLYYPWGTLKECANDWIDRSLWTRHPGGQPRPITDMIGDIRNTRGDEKELAIMGDFFFHCVTPDSRACADMAEAGVINAVSIEHVWDERYDAKRGMYVATKLRGLGAAIVSKGACDVCNMSREASAGITSEHIRENEPSRNGEASEEGSKMDEELANKLAEMEARLAALEEKMNPKEDEKGEEDEDEPKEMAALKESIKKMEAQASVIKELGEKVKALEMVPNRKTVLSMDEEKQLSFINE